MVARNAVAPCGVIYRRSWGEELRSGMCAPRFLNASGCHQPVCRHAWCRACKAHTHAWGHQERMKKKHVRTREQLVSNAHMLLLFIHTCMCAACRGLQGRLQHDDDAHVHGYVCGHANPLRRASPVTTSPCHLDHLRAHKHACTHMRAGDSHPNPGQPSGPLPQPNGDVPVLQAALLPA